MDPLARLRARFVVALALPLGAAACTRSEAAPPSAPPPPHTPPAVAPPPPTVVANPPGASDAASARADASAATAMPPRPHFSCPQYACYEYAARPRHPAPQDARCEARMPANAPLEGDFVRPEVGAPFVAEAAAERNARGVGHYCCYYVRRLCGGGRPLPHARLAGRALRAPVAARGEWA